MTTRIGQQVGNYQIIKLLGSGGFAEVYLAQHIHLKTRQVAIKILYDKLDATYEKQFLQEAQIIAALNHPNIIQIIDFGINGTAYLLMEYVPKGTLRDFYPEGSIVPLEQVLYCVTQIAAALNYTHYKNIIHRDLKPQNFLVRDTNEVLLSDFGIAATSHRTISMQASAYAGTAIYSAPEQLEGKPRFASDQYALAIVVYEWLCGSPPFTGTVTEIMFKHLRETPEPLSHRVTIAPAIEAVIMKALEKDPRNRFDSVKHFADALQEATKQKVSLPKDEAKIQQLYDQGASFLDTRRYEEAVAAFDQAIRLDPNHWAAYIKKGIALRNLTRYEEALVAYDQAIRLNQTNAATYINKGIALRHLTRYEEAVVAYDQAIRLDSRYVDAYIGKWYALRSLGRNSEAEAAYAKARQFGPQKSKRK